MSRRGRVSNEERGEIPMGVMDPLLPDQAVAQAAQAADEVEDVAFGNWQGPLVHLDEDETTSGYDSPIHMDPLQENPRL